LVDAQALLVRQRLELLQIKLAGNPDYQKIPQDKRKSSSMARAKLLLQSGKATDFDDVMTKI
jgi:hypothetical protein